MEQTHFHSFQGWVCVQYKRRAAVRRAQLRAPEAHTDTGMSSALGGCMQPGHPSDTGKADAAAALCH